MKVAYIKNAYLIIISMMVVFFSKDLYLLNTSDFYRVTYGFMESIPAFNGNLSLIYKINERFLPIYQYDYKSSYTLIIYIYALIVSLFTNYIDVHIMSSILKIAYVFTLFVFMERIFAAKGIVVKLITFTILALPLVSSSVISFFSSFYQEQIILICLPLLLFFSRGEGDKHLFKIFIFTTFISCAKSQFFYFPLLMLLSYVLFDRGDIIKKLVLMLIALALAIAAILTTKATTEVNKYHATYFGVYEYGKLNGIANPVGVDSKCVGFDAWGNEFSITDGAKPNKEGNGESCIQNNSNTSFLDVLKYFSENPSIIYKLPFDNAIKSQLTEDYFHVYHALKIIINDKGVFKNIKKLKGKVYAEIKIPLCFLLLLVSVIFFRKRGAKELFICSLFAISQFYISFIGEGYRDLAKHLFPMNFSFDLAVFVATIMFLNAFLPKKFRTHH